MRPSAEPLATKATASGTTTTTAAATRVASTTEAVRATKGTTIEKVAKGNVY